MQHKEQRVLVLFDVQNLYYSAKHLYNTKVNFKEILKKAVSGRKLIRAIAYVIRADIKDEGNFHEALNKIGIEVKAKDLQIFFGGAKKGDWDIGIAMDAVRLAQKVDTVVLVSGDGDFKDLCAYLKSHGCRTEALAFTKTASKLLKEEADMFFDLSSDLKKYLIGTPKMDGSGARPRRSSSSGSGSRSSASSGPSETDKDSSSINASSNPRDNDDRKDSKDRDMDKKDDVASETEKKSGPTDSSRSRTGRDSRSSRGPRSSHSSRGPRTSRSGPRTSARSEGFSGSRGPRGPRDRDSGRSARPPRGHDSFRNDDGSDEIQNAILQANLSQPDFVSAPRQHSGPLEVVDMKKEETAKEKPSITTTLKKLISKKE